MWHKSTLKSILFCGLIGFSLIGTNEVYGSQFPPEIKKLDKQASQKSNGYHMARFLAQASVQQKGFGKYNSYGIDNDYIDQLFKKFKILQGKVINNPKNWTSYSGGDTPVDRAKYIFLTEDAYDILIKYENKLKSLNIEHTDYDCLNERGIEIQKGVASTNDLDEKLKIVEKYGIE